MDLLDSNLEQEVLRPEGRGHTTSKDQTGLIFVGNHVRGNHGETNLPKADL